MNQPSLLNLPDAAAARPALARTRIAVVSASWHSDVVQQARDAAVRRLAALGAAPGHILRIDVLGAFEIPLMARRLAASGRFQAVIGCAVIVDGGIYRHDFVSAAVVDGLMRVQLDTGVPVFSVALTPHHFQPGEDLQGFFRQHFIKKGEEAADTCAQTLAQHAALDALLAGSETMPAPHARPGDRHA